LSKHILRPLLNCGAAAIVMIAALSGCTTDDMSPSAHAEATRPALMMTNEPAPEVLYHKGSRDTVLAGDADADLAPIASAPRAAGRGRVETLVGRKVAGLTRELADEKAATDAFRARLASLQAKTDAQASEYYSLVAAIQTELQAGTTAGNPDLTERWNQAQAKLDALSESVSALNGLSTDLTAEAAKAAYLQEAVRATYGLTGGVMQDRKNLQKLEDDVNQAIVGVNRLLTSVGAEINRRTAYLRAEHLNMQTLSLAISNGELYGQNMENGLFRKAAEDGKGFLKGADGVSVPAQRKPLVVIRFNRPGVDYQQAVYTAVSQALDKYPSAHFDLVAVSPSEGNPAQVALASAEARKNGEAVLRTLTQMGLPMERIRLDAANSRDVANSEVHLYIQ
jgi:hypothetical protein